MKLSRRIGGRPRRRLDVSGTCRRASGLLGWRLLVVSGGLALAGVAGCVNQPPLFPAFHQPLPAYQRGTSCSARNVESYAKARNLTYEQALAELRKRDQQLWDAEEARQQAAGSEQKAAGGGQ